MMNQIEADKSGVVKAILVKTASRSNMTSRWSSSNNEAPHA